MTTKNRVPEASAEEQLRTVLTMLACPTCQSGLVLETLADEVAVLCAGCGRRFAVLDGIPVLIAETA